MPEVGKTRVGRPVHTDGQQIAAGLSGNESRGFQYPHIIGIILKTLAVKDHAAVMPLQRAHQGKRGCRRGKVHLHHVGKSKKRLHPPAPGQPAIHGQRHAPGQHGSYEQGVQQRRRIGDYQRAPARFRVMLHSLHADTITETQQRAYRLFQHGNSFGM